MTFLNKTLATLATLTATGVAGAAALALAYAPRASGLRARIRTTLHELRERIRRPAPEPATPASEPDAIHAAAVHAEHEREHGADGRARAAVLGRKPHVPSSHPDTTVHSPHTRRHA